jgi:serine protease
LTRAVALAASALLLSALLPLGSQAADSVFRHPAADPSLTDRLIVKWRSSGVAAVQIEALEDRATRLSEANGIAVSPVRNLFARTDVMRLDHTPTHEEMQGILARLNADPGIEYAEPDGYRYIQAFPANAAPNDLHFIAGSDANGTWRGQWYLQPSSTTTPAALGATTAWQSTLGAASVVVAVIDTGVIAHPDLSGKLLPGYDFVSCDQGNVSTGGTTSAACSASGSAATYFFANDNGQNWHADGSDPGDWISTADATTSLFITAGCTTVVNSSWHGTKVAGVIGAVANNGIGIAGIAPNTMLLPVRVIGKCSGRVSDIVAGIMWASGQPVSGASASSQKANIINLSLGANTACSMSEMTAINAAIAAGILVVAAAGNEGGTIDAPANCPGVVSAVALRHTGTKVPFSNLSGSGGPAATIGAPGGNCVNSVAGQECLYDIETTTDEGTTLSLTVPSTTPGFYTYSLLNPSYLNGGGNSENAANVGTSYSAPMVSGVAALMLAAKPGQTPAQLIARLQSSALAFPTSSSTSTTQCTLASSTADSKGNFIEPAAPAECVCTTATCGAGMLNAAAAVAAAAGMFVQITPSHTSASPGQHVRLDGSGSTAAAGFSIVSYLWTTNPANDALISADQPVATLVMPSFRSLDVTLTITDNAGRTASSTITIHSALGAASGVGGFEPRWLALLAVVGLWQLRRRRQNSGGAF